MKIRRRKYLINKRFQGKFVLGFIVASLVGNVVTTILFIVFTRKKLEELQWSTHISAKTTGEAMQSLFINFNIINIVLVSLLLLIIGIWMMRKMNGPLFRITKDLSRVGEGDFSSPIIIRQKDEFQDVVVALNEMLDKMKEKLVVFKDKREEFSKGLMDLEIAHAGGEQVKEKVRTLMENIGK